LEKVWCKKGTPKNHLEKNLKLQKKIGKNVTKNPMTPFLTGLGLYKM